MGSAPFYENPPWGLASVQIQVADLLDVDSG